MSLWICSPELLALSASRKFLMGLAANLNTHIRLTATFMAELESLIPKIIVSESKAKLNQELQRAEIRKIQRITSQWIRKEANHSDSVFVYVPDPMNNALLPTGFPKDAFTVPSTRKSSPKEIVVEMISRGADQIMTIDEDLQFVTINHWWRTTRHLLDDLLFGPDDGVQVLLGKEYRGQVLYEIALTMSVEPRRSMRDEQALLMASLRSLHDCFPRAVGAISDTLCRDYEFPLSVQAARKRSLTEQWTAARSSYERLSVG